MVQSGHAGQSAPRRNPGPHPGFFCVTKTGRFPFVLGRCKAAKPLMPRAIETTPGGCGPGSVRAGRPLCPGPSKQRRYLSCPRVDRGGAPFLPGVQFARESGNPRCWRGSKLNHRAPFSSGVLLNPSRAGRGFFICEVRMITTSLHKLAARFMNLKEVAGTTHSPQIMAMLHLDANWPSGDEVPWCSAFVNYCCWLLDLPRSKSLAARSWLKIGRPVTLSEAVCGNDIVIFSRGSNPAQGHVAIFDRIDGDGVFVLGGNQGDAVTVARFPAASVIGVRRLA